MINLSFKHFTVLALFFSLAACRARTGQATPLPTTTTAPLPLVTTPPPAGPTPTSQTLPVPPQPTPEHILGGGTVQNGPFTFFLWLFRDPTMNPQPAITSLYSDLNGIGAYQSWVYHGPNLNGPLQVYWGTLPQLNLFVEYPMLTDGQGDARIGGVMLPGGFFMSGESHAGDHVQVVMKLVAPQGEYGAVLTFTLQQASNGFEPSEILVSTLSP